MVTGASPIGRGPDSDLRKWRLSKPCAHPPRALVEFESGTEIADCQHYVTWQDGGLPHL